MKIAILGTKGIPNNYGGFEQFAEYLSVGLVERDYSVTVYNPHFHIYKDCRYKGVDIKHIYSPEKYIGASANFIYDFLCLRDALKSDFDIILECGYHSNAPSYFLVNKKSYPILVTNMDGLEWKRSKWNKVTQWIIKKMEKLAVEKSHCLVSDNEGIRQYYLDNFGVDSYCIEYGAVNVNYFDSTYLQEFNLQSRNYFLLIARLEPENNIETILDGYIKSKETTRSFLVIGNYQTKYGQYLKKKYSINKKILFLGAIYDKNKLDSIRCNACIYFHGHSVGGTNPSLLEAMGSNAFIVSHSNIFNRSILKDNALYFSTSDDVADIIGKEIPENIRNKFILNNNKTISENYSWSHIIDLYENLFLTLLKRSDQIK